MTDVYYSESIEEIFTKREKVEVTYFLEKFGLQYGDVEDTIVIRDNNQIIATCSRAQNVLKCFAIAEEYQGLGLTNTLISHMTQKLYAEGIYHHFIFTKPDNVEIFASLGYRHISSTSKVALLEIGNNSIVSALDQLKDDYHIDTSKEYAAIVMNCNPFTLGHKYLIEQASLENENVIVFIVEEDKSAFKFRDRIELVRQGVKEFGNVVVLPASKYIISQATFPTYFIKQNDDATAIYTELDCSIFGKYFVNALNIKKRYVGNEPNCNLTSSYNDTMKKVLPSYGIDVRVVNRKEINATPISATEVRKLLDQHEFEKIKALVPNTTYNFLLADMKISA